MNEKELKEIRETSKVAYKKANQMGSKDCTLTLKDFTIYELKSLLLTNDGMGLSFKNDALKELIDRIEENAKQEVWISYGGI